VLHLVEPVIQRKRRLEAKRSMLEDWLRRLVARAKQVGGRSLASRLRGGVHWLPLKGAKGSAIETALHFTRSR
jgi:hypothetical protein